HEPAPLPPSPSRSTASPSSTGPASDATIPSPAPSPVNVRSQRSSSEELLSPPLWAVVSDHQRLRDLVLRFGLDMLPERARRLSRSDARIDQDDAPYERAGSLRRLELEKLLNPGGPS